MAGNKVIPLSLVQRIFSNWTALRMAVEHGMGTSEHARQFCDFVVETIAMNEQIHYSDIAIELEDYMDSIFNVRLEDESEMQVAQEIMRFQNLVAKNDLETLENESNKLPPLQSWITLTYGSKISSTLMDADSSEDDDDSNDEDDGGNDDDNKAKSNGMIVDDDGFTLVQRKKK